MLLVDRILDIDEKRAIAEKHVTGDEPYFEGHFPNRPVMPGVLILEAMAQTAGIGIYFNMPEHRGRGIALVGVDRVRFRKPVFPGDTLQLTVSFPSVKRRMLRAVGVASVRGENVAEAEFMAAIVDWESIK